MRDEACDACCPARPVPCAAEILDRLAIPTKEDPGHDLACLAGKAIGFDPLRLQYVSESGDERKLSALTIFCFTRFKPELGAAAS